MIGRAVDKPGVRRALSVAGAVAILAGVHVTGRASSASAVQRSGFLELTAGFPGTVDNGHHLDQVIAAGPDRLVLANNGSVTIRSKDGSLIASDTLRDFFADVRAQGQGAFDPRVLYDRASERFFVAAVGFVHDADCQPGACIADFLLGVSKSSTPAGTGTGDWHLYALDATVDDTAEGSTATASYADFTALTVSAAGVAVAAKMFQFADGSFRTNKIRVLDKDPLLQGVLPGWRDFVDLRDPLSGDLLRGGLRGAHQIVVPPSSSLFIVGPGAGGAVIFRIDDPAGAPTLAERDASLDSPCSSPPDAPQPGASDPLDTGSNGFHSNAVHAADSLWIAMTCGLDGAETPTAAVRWFEIDVSGWPSGIEVLQESTFGQEGRASFYPSIIADRDKNVALVYAVSSDAEFPSIYFRGRVGRQPPNELAAEVLLKAGTDTLPGPPDPNRGGIRYGDYFGTALDPVDGSVWIIGQYAEVPDTSETWVGHARFDLPMRFWVAEGPARKKDGED